MGDFWLLSQLRIQWGDISFRRVYICRLPYTSEMLPYKAQAQLGQAPIFPVGQKGWRKETVTPESPCFPPPLLEVVLLYSPPLPLLPSSLVASHKPFLKVSLSLHPK